MAIDSDLTHAKPSSIVSADSSSSTTSSSLLPLTNRKRLVQVATDNTATFIQFPKNARHAFPFIPISRPRTSHSSTRLSSHTADTRSISNQSKSSANAATSSTTSEEHKRDSSQQRINPILNNPLLNHRKEEIKSPPIKFSSKEYSRTTRLCLSSKPLKATTNDIHMPTIRASTAPILAHQKEINTNISDRLIISNDNKTSDEEQQQTQYVDDNKYDYITRWLNEVRAATYSNETFLPTTKRTKRRYVPS